MLVKILRSLVAPFRRAPKKKTLALPEPLKPRRRTPRPAYYPEPFEQPVGSAYAQDSAIKDQRGYYSDSYGMHADEARHFAEKSFIGYTMIAYIAGNWLVDKACAMPAGDAVRQGWDIQTDFQPLEGALKTLDEEFEISKKITIFLYKYVKIFPRVFNQPVML